MLAREILREPKPARDPRRTPVLEEAVAAAQGLTDDIESQVEIAAQLMGLPRMRCDLSS